MASRPNRRRFLTSSGATLVSLGGVAELTRFNVARAQESSSIPAVSDDIESLTRLITSTPRDEIAPKVADRLRKGLTGDDLLEALLLTVSRVSSGHTILVHHAVAELSSTLSAEDRLLPLFWHLDLIRSKANETHAPAFKDSQLPKATQAASVLEDAVRESDMDAATAATIAIARSEGPRMAYRKLWPHAAGARMFGSIGHTAIKVANTWRSMDRVGWQSAESLLHDSAKVSSSPNNRGNHKLHAVNARRAAQHDKFPWDEINGPSDEAAVIDLHGMFREGKAVAACRSIDEQLRSGKVSAASIWDAVFLTTNEISARFKWGGLVTTGRARHSITAANAMHFMYRTWPDPEHRIYTLLQAVGMTCDFLAIPRAGGHLNDFKITEIAEVEGPDSVEAAVEDIFSLLPPRRVQSQFRDRSGQDKALQLTYAMARQHPDTVFLQTAHRLLCQKTTIDAHHLKFPLAAFENYRYLSPKWRPHFLAASVFYLHGTQMEDNPAVQQARELLRG